MFHYKSKEKLSLMQMNSWLSNKRATEYAAAFMTIVVIVWILNKQVETLTPPRVRNLVYLRDLTRKRHIDRILWRDKGYCVNYLMIDEESVMHLASIIHDRHILHDTRHVSIEKQLTMFLYMIWYNAKNRTMQIKFLRSSETINKYFNDVVCVVCHIQDDFVQPP